MKNMDLQCALSGKSITLNEAVFFVKSPDNTLIADLNKELPGTHVCLECNEKVIAQAIEKDLFQGVLGKDLNIPGNFVDRVALLLRKKALEMLCMAKKSGLLIFGFEKVMSALKEENCDFILQASDGSVGGKNKTGLNAGNIHVCGVFTSEELGSVIGRSKVVHVMLLKGNISMSSTLAALIKRIESF